LIVFMLRYWDLAWNWMSVYLILFKIFYLGITVYTIYLIAFKYKASYQQANDRMPVLYMILPCILVGVIFAPRKTPFVISWSISLCLESVAILPQIYQTWRTRVVDNLHGNYVASLGVYRLFYLINWWYRNRVESVRTPSIVWITALIQTALYSDFLWYWVKSKVTNKKLVLPQ
ncbi:ER lumen protein retaining receptor, partial [Kipferlia bialata]